MICTYSYVDFRHRVRNYQPTIHTARETRKQGGPKEKNAWSPEDGEGDKNPTSF